MRATDWKVIHAVGNPAEGHSAGVHVYLGDLIAHDRTLWHPHTLQPMPFDNDKYFGLVREAEAVRALFPRHAEGPTPDR